MKRIKGVCAWVSKQATWILGSVFLAKSIFYILGSDELKRCLETNEAFNPTGKINIVKHERGSVIVSLIFSRVDHLLFSHDTCIHE